MLVVSDLGKRFDRRGAPALDGVNFRVDKGEIFGLLGHNGAGKSTALGIMLGMVYPDRGDVEVAGHSIRSERSRALAKVGAIFEAPSFYEYLTGWRNLKVLTALSGGVSEKDMRDTVEWVGLSERIHSKVGTYSHGMRQRLALAQALLPRPELLLLDEPTDGLDPDGIVEFRSRVHQLRDEFGVTILLNSHLLSEVEQTCDRVAILKRGRKVYEGGCQGLKEEERLCTLSVDDWDRAAEIAGTLGATVLSPGRLSLGREVEIPELVSVLVKEGLRISEVRPERRSLEDLYMEVGVGDDPAVGTNTKRDNGE